MKKTILLFALGLAGCHRSAPSVDQPRPVVVVTDNQTDIELVVRSIIDSSGWGSESGPEFQIRFVSLDNLLAVAQTPILLIIGTTNEEPINTLIGTTLKDSSSLFQINNRWAQNQLVLVVAARHESFLLPALERYRNRIGYTLRSYVKTQIKLSTYRAGYDDSLSDRLTKNYGFRFELPVGFTLVDTFKNRNFIYLVARNPDRRIFINWQPRWQDTRALDGAYLLATRDSLTAQFSFDDRLLRDRAGAETTKFLDSSALFISGVWQTGRGEIGGPFLGYGFNYRDRFYYIDASLPTTEKSGRDAIQQLAIILETFKPN